MTRICSFSASIRNFTRSFACHRVKGMCKILILGDSPDVLENLQAETFADIVTHDFFSSELLTSAIRGDKVQSKSLQSLRVDQICDLQNS